jgi:hypothetical protein
MAVASVTISPAGALVWYVAANGPGIASTSGLRVRWRHDVRLAKVQVTDLDGVK